MGKKPPNATLFAADAPAPAPAPTPASGPVVRVVLPTPVDTEFDYLLPAPLLERAERGRRVTVPFGTKRTLTGFITSVLDGSPLPAGKLKEVLEIPDEERLADEGMMRLTRWMADYYACSWGEALTAVIPAVMRRKQTYRSVGIVRLAKPEADTLAYANDLEQRAGDTDASPLRKQAKVLRTIANFAGEDFRPAILAERLGFSESPIITLRKQGWLTIERVRLKDESIGTTHAPSEGPGAMNLEQEHAVNAIATELEKDAYQTFLLKGVTGSGKTEVYIQVLRRTLDLGKSGIVLVPEIALTPQTVQRFTERLSTITGVAVIHSAMTDVSRRREWKRIRSGEARIVIGPRSAIFAPVKDLGIVIVDEEHEHSYKQDNTPRYHARDVAVMRCYQEQAVCVLGSATPSLESMFNALRDRYRLLELKKRVMDRRLPRVHVIDMAEECRTQRRFATLSNMLLQATQDAVGRGEQAVMFLNRRGYHSFFQCDNCRELLLCPNCDVPMALHRAMRKAVCHYCYEAMEKPGLCPTCRNGHLKPMGQGTELLEEEFQRILPNVEVARMDSDTMKKREDYEEMLARFRDGEVQVLVGTQMIAKGLDFPNVTVVGVINADLNLYLADFRAQERSFQLLTQVAGRAGRGDIAGHVYVQTFTPDHPCIRAAQTQDYDEFFKYEITQRKLASYPPWTRMVAITIEARDERKGREKADAVRGELADLERLHKEGIVGVLGPAVAPIARVRGRHRMQVMAKVADRETMQAVAERLRQHAKSSESLRVTVDVDPFSML